MSPQMETCPCWGFVEDPYDGRCACGDTRDEHDLDTGTCRVQFPADAPYDPALTERALRMAQRWTGTPPSPPTAE